jgi:glycosyltransferase involved in cell wall biosynthesis
VVLGLDASRLAGQRTGVARYLEYMLRFWSAPDTPVDRIELFSPSPLEGVPEGSSFRHRVEPSRGPGSWWQLTRLRPKASEIDVLFSPYVIPPGYRGRSVVSNLGILAGSNQSPGLRARGITWHHALSARNADVVIANSDATKDDIVRYFRVSPEKVTVIWPGVDELFRPPRADEQERIGAAVERALGERAPYVLYVGKLSERRNVPGLLEAFARVRAERPELRLLFVGPNTWGIPLESTAERLRLNGAVRHVEHLDHEALAPLYRGARAFALPTEQEGFSATILEAMASRCPVLTLDHAALRESGLDEAALVVRDASADTLADALGRLVKDEALRDRLADRGVEKAAGFSWAETARRTMDVIVEVARR